jgi:hypothetical protein
LQKKGKQEPSTPPGLLRLFLHGFQGPEPGDKDSGEDKSIEIAMQYRTAQGETGTILLSYWTPMGGRESSLPPDQRAAIAQVDQKLHDMSCRGIP